MATPEWSGVLPEHPHKRCPARLDELGRHESPVLRVASYNIRVDHSQDEKRKSDKTSSETPGQYPWDGVPGARRKLAVENIASLACDLICVQEPSPDQAIELQQDFLVAGMSLLIQVMPCDPARWGPGRPVKPREERRGQEWDGNGFIWNCRRLCLDGNLEQFWLSPTLDSPSAAHGVWTGASEFFRTFVAATFKDIVTERKIRAFSAHFDHMGSETREESAKLLMEKVTADANAGKYDCVIVCGDFNTFPTEEGATYRTLVEASEAHLVDIRGLCDKKTHRADDTWCGSTGGRFDHMFVSQSATVKRTAVVEDVLPASDHKPIVAEIML